MPVHYTKQDIVIPATFPRATRQSTRLPTDKLKLGCSVYSSDYSGPNGISLFMCHANGFVKELYEPLLDDLYEALEKKNVYVKYALAIDVVNQGASYILNEDKIGSDARWRDYWNDVVSAYYYLQSTDHPLTDLPVFGVGHSFGGNSILGAASINQKMFVSIVSIDSVVGKVMPPPEHKLSILTFNRADKWSSMEEARNKMGKKMLEKFDPRARELFYQYAFRKLPTAKYPNETSGVTLTTPITSELSTFTPLPIDLRPQEKPYVQFGPTDCFYGALPYVKVPKLMILGSMGLQVYPDFQEVYSEDKSFHFVPTEGSHLIPIEEPTFVAGIMAPFIATTYANWRAEQEADLADTRSRDFHPLYAKFFAPKVAELKQSMAKQKNSSNL